MLLLFTQPVSRKKYFNEVASFFGVSFSTAPSESLAAPVSGLVEKGIVNLLAFIKYPSLAGADVVAILDVFPYCQGRL